MNILIEFLKKIITNPRFEAFVIIGLTSLIRKTFMDAEKEEETIKEEIKQEIKGEIKEEAIKEEVEKNQPLFLPRGTIRAVLALALLAISAGSFIFKYDVPMEFHAMTLLAIGYYVGYRTDNTQLKEIKQ